MDMSMQTGSDLAEIGGAKPHSELQFAAFGQSDLVNLILQRSEVLGDLPRMGQVIRAWNEGDSAPILAQAERLGAEIARRAAGVIHAEYLLLKPVLAALKLHRIADIGCGYAMFDLFAARDLGAHLLLIDIESNERRHFGFAEAGAAYSSLAVARAFLEQNGVHAATMATLNPTSMDPVSAGPVDLAVSFLSCGFHYPVETYLEYFDRGVTRDGAVILDLRATTAEAQIRALAPLGAISDLPSPPKARRVLLRKGAPA